MPFTTSLRFLALFLTLVGFDKAFAEAERRVTMSTAAEVLDSWKAGQITGICPLNRIPPEEIERLKQAVVASGYLSADYGRGGTACTMILCPNAKVPPYVFPTDDAFNRFYTASENEGRPCFTHTEPL